MVTIFRFLLFVSLPNTQKWAKNEFENELKMAQEWLPWTTLMFAEHDDSDIMEDVISNEYIQTNNSSTR